MSGGTVCKIAGHRGLWRVLVLRANYSAFNGYHRTPSAYSTVRCGGCSATWRTKAGYVDSLPSDVDAG